MRKTVRAQLPSNAVADSETALGYLVSLDGWDLFGEGRHTGSPEVVQQNLTRRAGWGLHAVQAHTVITAGHTGLNEGVGTQLEFLVADLLHLCDALGMDFEQVTEQARVHYDGDITIY